MSVKEGGENEVTFEMGFDADKCVHCVVEGSQTLVHGPGGRGYGLSLHPITSGASTSAFLLFYVLT